jgi:hypothetical protein
LLEASTRRRRPACCASLPHGLHVYGSAGASRQSEREQGSMPPDLHSAPPPRVPCFVGHHEQARVEQPRAWASSALSTMAAASLRPGSPHRGDEGRRQFFSRPSRARATSSHSRPPAPPRSWRGPPLAMKYGAIADESATLHSSQYILQLLFCK